MPPNKISLHAEKLIIKIMKEADKEILLRVWESLRKDEVSYLDSYTKTINYYSTILLGIISASILIIKDIDDEIFRIFGLVIFGIAIIITSIIGSIILTAIQIKRLDTITELAKIEDIIELTSKEKYSSINYWKDEGIIATRSIETRKRFESSKEFIDFFLNKGRINKGKLSILFLGFIGIAFITYGIVLMF